MTSDVEQVADLNEQIELMRAEREMYEVWLENEAVKAQQDANTRFARLRLKRLEKLLPKLEEQRRTLVTRLDWERNTRP